MTETSIIVTAILAFLSTCFTGVMAYLLARMNTKQGMVATKVEDAAVKVEEVKTTLAISNQVTKEELHEIKEVGIATHTLVNNNMGIQLKINVVALRRIASLCDATLEDKEAAEMAEKLYSEHMAKQAIVDNAKAKVG